MIIRWFVKLFCDNNNSFDIGSQKSSNNRSLTFNCIIDSILLFNNNARVMNAYLKIIVFSFLLFFLPFLSGCSGDCATAENMMTDPVTITLEADAGMSSISNLAVINPQKNADLWVPTEVMVTKVASSDPKEKERANIKFTLLSDAVNLCGLNSGSNINSNNVRVNIFGQYFKTGIKVSEGDNIKFELNKDKIKVNCDSPDPRIAISNVDYCKNGYYKKGVSGSLIPSNDGADIEVDSYVAPDFGGHGTDLTALFLLHHDTNKIYNAFVPVMMIASMYDVTMPGLSSMTSPMSNGYRKFDGVIPGKAFIVPEEHEVSVPDDDSSARDCDKGLMALPAGKKCEDLFKYKYEYSAYPKVPSDDAQFMLDASGRDKNKVKQVENDYWCRIYDDSHGVGKKLNRSANVNSVVINKRCGKYYYLDDENTTMEYNAWEAASLSSKPKGNTNDQFKKIYSVLENKSYTMMDSMEIPSDLDDDSKNILNNMDKKIEMINSKFFYMLQAEISATDITTTQFMKSNDDGNLNKSFASCGQQSRLSRCDAKDSIQIPLDFPIPVKNNGEVYVKVGNVANQTEAISMIGNANLKVTRICPNKSIYGLLLPAGANAAAFNVKPGEGASFEIPLYENGNLDEPLSELVIKYSDIENKINSNVAHYLYLAIKDNGDGYRNNSGAVRLVTRLPRNTSGEVTRFINRTITKVMNVLYGNSAGTDGIVNSIYKNIIGSSKFQAIIRASAVLLIVIYGISIVMGLMQFNLGDLTRTVIKFGVIYVLLQPGSWEFFHRNFFNLFINGPRHLLTIVTTPPDDPLQQYSESDSNPGTGRYIFGPISEIVNRFTDFAIWKQILAVLFAGPFGWVIFFFLMQSSIIMLEGSLTAILQYIVSLTLVGIFISIAPLFIITLMFKATVKIFKAWVKVLMTNALNVVFLFTGIMMISGILSLLINQVFGFGVCTSCALQYHGPVKDFNFCIMYADLPDGFDNTLNIEERADIHMSHANLESGRGEFFGIPIPFYAMVCFIIVSHLMSTLTTFFTTMAEDISAVDYGNPTREQNITASVKENMKSFVGQSKEQKSNKVRQRVKAGAKAAKTSGD